MSRRRDVETFMLEDSEFLYRILMCRMYLNLPHEDSLHLYFDLLISDEVLSLEQKQVALLSLAEEKLTAEQRDAREQFFKEGGSYAIMVGSLGAGVGSAANFDPGVVSVPELMVESSDLPATPRVEQSRSPY